MGESIFLKMEIGESFFLKKHGKLAHLRILAPKIFHVGVERGSVEPKESGSGTDVAGRLLY